MRLQTTTGLLYVLPAIAVLVVWYVLLFVGNAPGDAPNGTLSFVLTDGPRPWWFRWLFALPFLCLGLASAYWSRIAVARAGSVALLAIGDALAVASWLTVSAEVALFTTMPLVFAVLSVREVLRPGRRGT